jgi:hypothetical protein
MMKMTSQAPKAPKTPAWISGLIVGMALGCSGKKDAPVDTADTSPTVDTGEPDTGEPDTGESTNPIDDDFTVELTLYGGCSDIFMYAKNSDDSLGLFISASALVETTFSADAGTHVFNLDVATAENNLSIVVQSGQNITREACNDALEEDMQPVVHFEGKATSGNAQFSITPAGEATDWGEMPANATLILEDVVFPDASGDDQKSLKINNWGFDAAVGWLPG